MFVTSRFSLQTVCATVALLAIVDLAQGATARREPNGAVRFYDDLGQDRGYAWCLKRNARWFGGWSDCSFYSYGQCRAASFGPPGGDCEPNPFAAQVTAPPSRKRRAR